MKNLICIWLLTLVCVIPNSAFGFDFSPYGRILDRYLSTGQTIHGTPVNTLDYQALAEQAGPGSDWKLLLGALAAFEPASLADREQRMAFWINVYNIAAIKTILDHWPVDSIRSRTIDWLGSPWQDNIIRVGGRDYSLQQIEFDQLIDGFNDLRPHLGINCASTSCVDLAKAPYSGADLDRQLQRQGELLVKQPEKGLKIDRQAGRVAISRIFDFDAGHFNRLAGGAIPFLLDYVTEPADRDYLQRGNYDLEFLDYDWTLNDTRQAD